MVRLVIWTVVLFAITADYSDTNLYARCWYWSSRYWYSLARFAGTVGLASEKKYHEEMDSVNG